MPPKTPIARRTLIATMLGMATGAFAVTLAVAQTVTVPNAPTCPRCIVVAESLFTLGTTDADMLAPSSQLSRDRRGRFFGTAFGGRSIVVWDSTGKYLRTLGGPGEGPGEMSQPISRIVVGRDDSIFVGERSLRVSVFSPNLTFARTIRLHARPTDLALLPNGQLLLGTQLQSPAGVGHPFHLVDGVTGTVIRSFGLEGAVVMPGQTMRQPVFDASPDGASLWSWTGSAYRLERWGLDGIRREILDMSATPWYRAPVEPAPMTAEERQAFSMAILRPGGIDSVNRAMGARTPPRSTVQVAGVAPTGEIWMLSTEPVVPIGDPKTVKSWLEIIDPVTRRKVVSARAPGWFKLLPGTDLIYTKGIDANTGVTMLTVSRVRIQGR